jgi:ferritin-like metal-binding protein YciE
MPLYWLCYRHDNQISVVIEPAPSIVHARMRAALAGLDEGTFTEGHELDRKMLGMLKGNELRDAGLIASAQKLEHYEIAAYGTVAALAGQLDLRDDQQMLHESLEEEKQADVRLTKLAKGEVNPDALAA